MGTVAHVRSVVQQIEQLLDAVQRQLLFTQVQACLVCYINQQALSLWLTGEAVAQQQWQQHSTGACLHSLPLLRV
jgi:hypothetical protein